MKINHLKTETNERTDWCHLLINQASIDTNSLMLQNYFILSLIIRLDSLMRRGVRFPQELQVSSHV